MWSREAFLNSETLLGELPAIGRSKQENAVGEVLKPHNHPDAYEIVLITNGRLRWWVESEELLIAEWLDAEKAERGDAATGGDMGQPLPGDSRQALAQWSGCMR